MNENRPPEPAMVDSLQRIRRAIDRSGRKVIVFDDDPTGTQSVHDVDVLLNLDSASLSRVASAGDASMTFLLTNSRAMAVGEVVELYERSARSLTESIERSGGDWVAASRGDSTLRGHFPAEPDALAAGIASAGGAVDGVILCPSFFEAGRVTVDDIHWVRDGESAIPVGETEYARDPSFGYEASNLREWVREIGGDSFDDDDVVSVSLEDIRLGGVERVTDLLAGVSNYGCVVVNALGYGDLEVFVLGLLEAERQFGKRFVYRVGPSFCRVRGGVEARAPLTWNELYPAGDPGRHGLVVVGSYVGRTTNQTTTAIRECGLHSVELDVGKVLDPATREWEIHRAAAEIQTGLAKNNVAVYTSRSVVRGSTRAESLRISHRVSMALVAVIQRLAETVTPRYVVAKGGITASDVARYGLGVEAASVAGQMFRGLVPVWILPEGTKYPGMPYVIFPGNVGDRSALARVVFRLGVEPERRKDGQ